MSAPLDAFVAGAYYLFYTAPLIDIVNYPLYGAQGTLPSVAGLSPGNGLGIPSWVGASMRGFTLTSQMSADAVEGDIFGGSVVDVIYRGGNMFLSWESIAFKPGSLLPYWPWNIIGSMGTIGRLGSVVGGGVVMQAAPLTPAAGVPAIGQVVINSLTAPNAILAENFGAELVFDSRLRKVPIRLRLLPYMDKLLVFNTIPAGTTASLATAGYTVNNTQPIVATIVLAANQLNVSYTVASVAAYKWYNIL